MLEPHSIPSVPLGWTLLTNFELWNRQFRGFSLQFRVLSTLEHLSHFRFSIHKVMGVSLLIERGLFGWFKPTMKEEEAVESQRQATVYHSSAVCLPLIWEYLLFNNSQSSPPPFLSMGCMLERWLSSVILELAALTSLDELLEIHINRPCPRATELQTLGIEPIDLSFNKLSK